MSTGSPSRRNSLRVASFGPPTVSCVLAAARTCIRQAPPTSRGRGVATSAVADRLSGYASSLSFSSFEVLMKAIMLFMASFVTIYVSVLKLVETRKRGCVQQCSSPVERRRDYGSLTKYLESYLLDSTNIRKAENKFDGKRVLTNSINYF